MKRKTLVAITILCIGILYIIVLRLANYEYSEESLLGSNQEIPGTEFNTEGKIAKMKRAKEYTKYFKDITTKFGEEENGYPLNYRMKAFTTAREKKTVKNTKFTPIWEQRGPTNVGGRTRGLIIDPDDTTYNTWYVGSSSGGVWKTTDGGQNWVSLTDGFPNLSTNAIEMAESNHDIIYIGTGESFPGGTYIQGSGMFKSTDRGNTWSQIESTANNEDFKYVNRIAIDPTNPDIVMVATENGILKTINGGQNWLKNYNSRNGIEDLKANPTDFNILYAAENGVGILKSTDGGDSWELSSNGLGIGYRYEIAVSPVNPVKVYTSVSTGDLGPSEVYRTTDGGASWVKFNNKSGERIDFLGGQGEYDNTIAAHPFNEDEAFLGGINLWKVNFSDPGNISESWPDVMRVDEINTHSFLDFVYMGGSYFDGRMIIGTNNGATNLNSKDFVSVEIRFGPGLSQKAHRFTVNGQGAGVPPSDYIYQDYVEVPFEVWDVTNNKQIMVSFRDQEENGEFNLNIWMKKILGANTYLLMQLIILILLRLILHLMAGNPINNYIFSGLFWRMKIPGVLKIYLNQKSLLLTVHIN